MSFLNQLAPEDLRRLREVVKRVHLKHYPKSMVNDYEADKLIEAFGPEVAAQLVKAAVDAKAVD